MLPGANGVGIADTDRFACQERPDDVGDQPIACPVAAADDIAGPGRGKSDSMFGIAAGIEEGSAIGGGDQFRAALAVRIRIIAAKRFVFAVPPDPFPVFVALVGGDVDDRPYVGQVRTASSRWTVPMTLIE